MRRHFKYTAAEIEMLNEVLDKMLKDPESIPLLSMLIDMHFNNRDKSSRKAASKEPNEKKVQ